MCYIIYTTWSKLKITNLMINYLKQTANYMKINLPSWWICRTIHPPTILNNIAFLILIILQHTIYNIQYTTIWRHIWNQPTKYAACLFLSDADVWFNLWPLLALPLGQRFLSSPQSLVTSPICSLSFRKQFPHLLIRCNNNI